MKGKTLLRAYGVGSFLIGQIKNERTNEQTNEKKANPFLYY